MLKGKYYYVYLDSHDTPRGVFADSKYEALYNASCLCGEIIPSSRMKKGDYVAAAYATYATTGTLTPRQMQRLMPTRATLANARHKINAMT